MPKIRHPERMPRSYRKRQIANYFKKMAERDGACCGMSALDIANMLGIAKSTHLYRLLWEMVEEGAIKAYPSSWLNGWDMWIYTSRDCEMEQLELFHDLES